MVEFSLQDTNVVPSTPPAQATSHAAHDSVAVPLAREWLTWVADVLQRKQFKSAA